MGGPRVVNCGKTRLVQRRAHPPRRTRAHGRHFPIVPEAIELRARLDAYAHELRFVQHPQAVVVQ